MVAVPLPPGEWQFLDANGVPLALGTVAHYQVGGLTPASTWQDFGQTILNANPITLDASGRAIIFGSGQYRQIVKDVNGNTIWDRNTATFINNGADVVLTFTGGPPGSTQWLGGEALTRTVTFAANFAGSSGKIPKTLPTATFVISVQKNGVQVGTATCSTIGAWTFATTGGTTVTFNPGDEIDFFGPSADLTMANFGVTLAGNFVPS